MVTTRRQSGNTKAAEDHKFAEEDSIVVDTFGSSISPQSGSEYSEIIHLTDDEGDASPSIGRKKVLPVRGKDNEGLSKNTRVVVEIPFSLVGAESNGPKAIGSRGNMREAVDGGSVEEDDSDAIVKAQPKNLDSKSGYESETFKNARNEREVSSKKASTETGSQSRTVQTQHLAAKDKASEQMATEITTVKLKHKRFGSEEAAIELTPTDPANVASDDESSDDDAPEVVATQDALTTARSKAHEAARTVAEQESLSRMKRRDRDAVLKHRAKSGSKKRKRSEDINCRVQDATASDLKLDTASKSTRRIGLGNDMDYLRQLGDPTEKDYEGAGDSYGSNFAEEGLASTKSTIKLTNLPELLPDEYLQDEAAQAVEQFDPEPTMRKAKKMKFTNAERRVKDRRIGSTTFRVSEVVRNTNLAPKASFQARSIKESWLKGRSGKNVGSFRKPFSRGFFKSKN